MKIVILGLVSICIILTGIFVAATREHDAPRESVSPTEKMYRSEALGIAFDYPAHYYLEEKNLSTGARTRYALILTEDTEENRAVREGTAGPREGPTAITIDIFQNNLDNYTTEKWVRGTNDSNFKLSPDGVLTATLLGGEAALTYRWSGLYEGETVAVARPDFIYAASVTFLTPEDTTRDDFDKVLESVRFTDSTPELE